MTRRRAAARALALGALVSALGLGPVTSTQAYPAPAIPERVDDDTNGSVRVLVRADATSVRQVTVEPPSVPPPSFPGLEAEGEVSAEVVYTELYLGPSTVVAAGTNTTPVGSLGVTTYRVEEVTLAEPRKLMVDGRPTVVDRAWRVIIAGGPFPLRALPPVVWLDDTILGYGQQNDDLSEVTTIVFDRSSLREGGTLAVSYGEDARARVALPEPLTFADRGGR